jgi:CHAT domain-containing protein/tetratricopeptide (TPR) repeat protein
LPESHEHLSSELLHRLVEAGTEAQRVPELASANRHLAVCDVCRQRLGAYRTAQRELEGMRLPVSREQMRTAECPSESEWLRLAAGLLEEDGATRLVDHAAGCGYCGKLLREAMEDLSSEFTEEERRRLDLLPSAQGEIRTRLATQMASAAAGGARPARRLRRVWVWTGVAAAAAVAIVAILLSGHFGNRSRSAEKLLAEAYSSNRILQLRIPGAGYAPMSTVRGAGASQPLPLLRAEVLIDRELSAHPSSPVWTALRGRTQLLQGHFDQARSTLRQALRLDPHSPAILTDLATAEYELAQQEGREEDFMAAAQHLSEALKLRPRDRVALFNRALVYESMGSLPLAVADWERYLRADPSSDWATKVARGHLEELKKRLGSSPQSELVPSDPAAAAAWLARRLKQTRHPAINSADEQLLEIAVTRWLPDVYAAGGAPDSRRKSERLALDRLARVLATRHGDRWLEDVLATPRTPALAAGLEALSEAVRLNVAGRSDEAEAPAKRAIRLLHAADSPAAMRAETALVYAYQREAGKANRCVAAARSALRDLGHRSYPWMEAQLLLERGSCEGVEWRLGTSHRAIERATTISQANGYGALYLRAIGFLAEFAGIVGNDRQSLRGNRMGLDAYWDGSNPPMRAYQFYSDMLFAAEADQDWLVAEGLAKECAGMITKTANRPMEAVARFRLATIADFAGDPATARQEFKHAASIFASLPPDPTVEAYEADCQVYLANLEVETGTPRRALARLLRMRSLVRKRDQGAFTARYFRVLGQAYLAEGDVARAEGTLLKAVAIAEQGLASLKTESDRVSWDSWYAQVYRSLVRAELKGRNDPTAALAIWEWYRSGPVRAEEGLVGAAVSRLLRTGEKSSRSAGATEMDAFRPAVVRWLESELPGRHGRTVISYAEFPDGIEIWALDGRAIESRWIGVPQRKFDRVTRHFEEDCADPRSNLAVVRSDGRQLYRWLVAPIASRLAAGRVVAIETDGAIEKIPLGALVDAKGGYLGDRVVVVHSPGLALERELKSGGKFSAADRVLAIGAPALSGDWQSMFAPLPEADEEARAVAASFRSATLLTGGRATLPAVLHDLPETEILHFAGHALATGGRTGLLLAAGGEGVTARSGPEGGGAEVLAASELNASNLRECRLAVLSACSTARSEGTELVDPGALVGAFLLAGVPDVVASRWDVNSSVTTRLMQAFYKRLLAGDSTALALARATGRIQQSPMTAHPYYWAAFSVYGR